MDSMPSYIAIFVSLLLFSSFVKIATTLAILRQGLGLSAGIGLAFGSLALVLSALVVEPQLAPYGGFSSLVQGTAQRVNVEQSFTPFLEEHSDPKVVAKLSEIYRKIHAPREAKAAAPDTPQKGNAPFSLTASAFLVSEVSAAFQLGFVLLIPFLVIDLLVVNILMALSVTQISQQVVALPLKILLFVAVDGWSLLAQKLVGSYVPS